MTSEEKREHEKKAVDLMIRDILSWKSSYKRKVIVQRL